MNAEKTHTTQLDRIMNQLKELSTEELEHAETFLTALFTKKDLTVHHYLGKFLEIDEEKGIFTMKLGKQHENTHGVAQGGTILTLADIAIGFQLISELPKDVKVFTLELKLNFIKSGVGEYLSAKPTIIHIGKTTAVAECDILDAEDNIIAKSLGTFYLKRPVKG